MAWIKRNLYFVIGSTIAVLLMGFGVFVLITQISKESEVSGQIDEQFEQLKKLYGRNPFPGDPSTIDNIAIANTQAASVREYAAKVRPLFGRIPGIPDTFGTSNKVSNSDFAAQLRNTVTSLRRNAEQQSVLLPPDYYFTFESQRRLMIFEPTSLDKLAVQLGEVKALSGILFDAKINRLLSIRREMVSSNDQNLADYLDRKTISTPLADISPYEITFECFSTELAYVMSHFSASTNGWIVKSINVESTSGGSEEMPGGTSMYPNGTPGGQGMTPQPKPFNPEGMQGAPGGPPPGFARPAYPPPGGGSSGAANLSRASQEFLKEKLFRVTMGLDLVKLKPSATPTK